MSVAMCFSMFSQEVTKRFLVLRRWNVPYPRGFRCIHNITAEVKPGFILSRLHLFFVLSMSCSAHLMHWILKIPIFLDICLLNIVYIKRPVWVSCVGRYTWSCWDSTWNKSDKWRFSSGVVSALPNLMDCIRINIHNKDLV